MPRLLLLALVLPLAACESPAPEVPGTPRAVGDLSETFVDADSSEPLAVDSSELAPASNEPSTDGPDWTPYEALRGWVGHSPVKEDGTHFVLDPSVRPTIEEAFSVEPGLMAKLSHLDTEPSRDGVRVYEEVAPIEGNELCCEQAPILSSIYRGEAVPP